MDNPIIMFIFLGVVVVGILVGVVIYCAYQSYLDKKRLENIKTNLHLIENQNYEIILNNSNKLHDMKFKYISYGNKSENGKINLYFDKLTKYRGKMYYKETMVKFYAIWKITNVTQNFALDLSDGFDYVNEIKGQASESAQK